MASHGNTSLVKPRLGRRLVLFPVPFQGHINPMLQLASILYSEGFSITILHTHFNSPNPFNYPHFTFQQFPEDLIESKTCWDSFIDLVRRLNYLNQYFSEPFHDCLSRLMSESASKEPIVCLVTDVLWHFSQSVTDSLKLPRIGLRTSSMACLLVYAAFPLIREKVYFNLPDQDLPLLHKATIIMASHGNTSLVKPRLGRRLVLFPVPFQGHINPMLQLASILYSEGFSITILHTHFNSPNPFNYPHFTFQQFPEDLIKSKTCWDSFNDLVCRLNYLNQYFSEPFYDCLSRLMSENFSKEPIVCLITDVLWHFSQFVADRLKLPRIGLRTSSMACVLVYASFPILREKGYFNLPDQDSVSEAPVPEFPLLKAKDIPKIVTHNSEGLCELIANMIKQAKVASGIIWNSFRELEEPEFAKIVQDFPVPHFPVGPFYKYFSASPSSLLPQDLSCISWLDLQPQNSVIYVSFGSVALVNEVEFKEMAWGLSNSKQPFLWVVRPGSVRGSEWLELLPNGFIESVGQKGHIVKWAPQPEVLAHPATGAFWTHAGWNSTLESICEGVPMICSPFSLDQPIDTRYVTNVWKIGLGLENGLEREEIERTIKRIVVEKEGEEMKERVMRLKEKVNAFLIKGGSSSQSLESLVDYILSF